MRGLSRARRNAICARAFREVRRNQSRLRSLISGVHFVHPLVQPGLVRLDPTSDTFYRAAERFDPCL